MKRRPNPLEMDSHSAFDALCRALCALREPEEMAGFLHDLCTPAELEAMADRWQVVAPLIDGVAYRSIHDETGVSPTTIGRVARCLNDGSGGYRMAARRLADAGDPAFDHMLKNGRVANDERH